MRKIDEANAETLRRMLAGDPVLVHVVPAGQAIRGLGERNILHAGPPIGWARMCGPMRGAVAGIAVFEGWAKDLEDAEAKAASDTFRFEHPRLGRYRALARTQRRRDPAAVMLTRGGCGLSAGSVWRIFAHSPMAFVRVHHFVQHLRRVQVNLKIEWPTFSDIAQG